MICDFIEVLSAGGLWALRGIVRPLSDDLDFFTLIAHAHKFRHRVEEPESVQYARLRLWALHQPPLRSSQEGE